VNFLPRSKVLYSQRIPRRAKFYTYDLSSYGIVIDGPVYLGPFWNPAQYFLVYLGVDTSPKTKRRRGFYNTGVFDDHAPSSELGVVAIPQYRAFGIRAIFSPI
jgi:hypothetical protein